ncbi:MAG: TfuA-like protein [Nitriliruptoraceae bacterium]
MTAYVFLGPTLPVEQAREVLDAVYLPPVAQGDVYRATLHEPSLIAIIDGYFERVPAVWHKEILWALDQGIPVLGAASMGALRAAELDTFGMEGIGRVYTAFRDEVLEDDDEVAVVHAPAEDGYRAMSEAMVNIRRTIADAAAAEVIDATTEALVLDVAKGLYYAERSYPAVLHAAADAGADPAELDRLRAFVADHAVDQKREDALALLAEVGDRLATGRTAVQTTFTFQYSEFWYEAQRTAGRLHLGRTPDGGGSEVSLAPAASTTGDELLDELRLDPTTYRHAWAEAYARLGALEHLRGAGLEVSPERLQDTADAFRRERGLLDPVDAARWLRDNDLTEPDAAALMHREALVRWSWTSRDRFVQAQLPDHLRLVGLYPALVDRARDKAERLAEVGWAEVSLDDLGTTLDEVLAWYFRDKHDTEVPHDLAAYATAHGYANEAHLRRTLVREYAYETLRRRATVGER